MKKILAVTMLAICLGIGSQAQAASSRVDENQAEESIKKNPAGNNVAQFTGKYWLQSSPDNREAYLFGLESAITVDIFENNRQMEAAKQHRRKAVSMLSDFAKGWSEAFVNVSRREISDEVTSWYDAHPESIDKPVLAVIWHDLIQPRLAKDK